jgi:hypothetical protein
MRKQKLDETSTRREKMILVDPIPRLPFNHASKFRGKDLPGKTLIVF